MSKRFFLTSLIILTQISCTPYLVGEMMGISQIDQSQIPFTYHTEGKNIIMEGKTARNEVYSGEIYPVTAVWNIEKMKHPNIPRSIIKKRNNFAYAKLSGNAGGEIQCFIKQNSNFNFTRGGEGICYGNRGEVLELQVKSSSIFIGEVSDWFRILVESF